MAAKKKTPAKKKPAPKKTTKPASRAAPKKSGAKSGAKKGGPKKASSFAKKGSAGAKKGGARVVRKSKRPAPKRKVAPKKVSKAVKGPVLEAPEALALARSIVAIAADKKAEGMMIIDTRASSAAVGYDYVVLATGESDRQLSAITEAVDDLLKEQGKRPSSVEASPDWVCVTYDEGVVAHFFTPDRRDLMDLEGLWKDAPRVTK